jgi:hypothetical protein
MESLTRLKRRGILAAATAAVAELVAKQSMQPVGATGTPITTGDTVTATTTTTLDATASTTALVVKNNFTGSVDQMSFGIAGFASGGAAGVFGRNNDLNGVAVWGEAPNGTGIFGDSSSRAGVAGSSNANGIGAVTGASSGGTGIGVLGQADSSLAVGVSGTSTQGIGGSFQGGHAPLLLVPAGSGIGHPVAVAHTVGEFYVDSAGTVWYCAAGGTPGTWQQLTGIAVVTLGGVSSSSGTTEVDVTGAANNTAALYGSNQSSGTGCIGVKGTAANGLGASFQGGHAPLLLVPGAVPAANLAATGHQAGELYVTSDNRLFFYTGTAWHEVALGPPNALPQAQPASTVSPPAPAPLPPTQSPGGGSGSPNPLPNPRP